MQKLVNGLAKFKKEGFVENKELFDTLASGQQPEALLITCSDSRIDPSLITQTRPGELFIIRNAGNVVPPHITRGGGVTASIEFAIKALGVQHVIVCGHSDCGAVKGAIKQADEPNALQGLPQVSNWLGHCSAAVEKVRARHGSMSLERLQEVTRENVLLQLTHLESHPAVAAGLASGKLELHAWVYDIGKGSVECYDAERKAFVPAEERYSDLMQASGL